MKKMLRTISIIMCVALLAAIMATLVACNGGEGLRFAAPDGTPALAMLRLASQGQKLDKYDVEYEVVSPNNIAAEMAGGKADIVIMPINVGAMQIVKNGVDYKLVSVAVEGSLYLVGHKEPLPDGTVPAVTLDDIKGKRIACIGEQGVPGIVFRYVMGRNGISIVTDDGGQDTPGENEIFVEYVADGSVAAQRYYGGQADFIVVGEPAATAQKAKSSAFATTDPQYARRLNAEMNMQTEYANVCGVQGADNYPQAGLFVKTDLTKNSSFMRALFEALEANEEWVENNPEAVTDEAKKIGSTSTFPKPAIPRCALDLGELDEEDEAEILAFLKNVVPNAAEWDEGKERLF